MHQIIYFIIGLLIAIVLIKIIFPTPTVIQVTPTLDNYDDITYIDDEGKLYKYEMSQIQ